MKVHLLASVASVAAFAMPRAFMSDTCDTVMAKIKGGNGDYVRVNKSDVDANPEDYTVSKPETAKAAADAPAGSAAGTASVMPAPNMTVPPAPSAPVVQPPAPSQENNLPTDARPPLAPAANSLVVIKEKNKFYVAEADGTKLVGVEGVDEKGYPTEKEAYDAVIVGARNRQH